MKMMQRLLREPLLHFLAIGGLIFLLFITSVFAAISLAQQITRRIDLPRPAWAWAVPPYAIGGIAAFWVIQRIAAFI